MRSSYTVFQTAVWHLLTVRLDDAIARSRDAVTGCTVFKSCIVEWHHSESSGYRSSADGGFSYAFCSVLDRSSYCFGS